MPITRALVLGLTLMLAYAAWAGPAAAESIETLPPRIHQVSAGDVTAHFGNDGTNLSPSEPPSEYGVTHLWFTFAGDDQTYLFRPKGDMHFNDWQFDIFAPDGRHVLLKQDHYGPYHIVRTSRLREYLLGRAGPDAVASGDLPSGVARVLDDARWTSATSIEFTATCCGDPEQIEFKLPAARDEPTQ